MLIVKTSLIPKRLDALALGFFVAVRPECADDEALLAHEAIHLKQQRKYWYIGYAFMYIFSTRFRAKMEVEGYRAQGMPNWTIVRVLVELYGIDTKTATEMVK